MPALAPACPRITIKGMPRPLVLPVRAFIFDLDGTLIDSKMDLVNSVNAMLQATGRTELATETIASYIGHGAPQLIASALGPDATESDRQNALAIFLAHYHTHSLDLTTAYEGVMEGLTSLIGYPMAVLTNKPLKMTIDILRALDMAKFFAGIYGGDSFPMKKPDPAGALSILRELGAAPEGSAMVGDSDVDIQTARNSGMRAIAVTYGFGKYDRSANPADLYIDNLTKLLVSANGRKS
jgi:phosphoglycolate phosphatase